MRETVEQAYVRGQQEMRDILALAIEISLGKEPAEKMRKISPFSYSEPTR